MVPILVLATVAVFVIADLVITRQQRKRRITEVELLPAGGFSVPRGYFMSPGHSWVHIAPNGQVKIGIDDFLRKLLGTMDSLEVTPTSSVIARGEPMFQFQLGDRTLSVPSPISGRILDRNPETVRKDFLRKDPYAAGWILAVEPSNLEDELSGLSIGEKAVEWMRQETRRAREFFTQYLPAFDRQERPAVVSATAFDGGFPLEGALASIGDDAWGKFEREFLRQKTYASLN